MSGADDHTVKVWSLVDNHMICDITSHDGSITHVDITSDKVIVSTSVDGKVVSEKKPVGLKGRWFWTVSPLSELGVGRQRPVHYGLCVIGWYC